NDLEDTARAFRLDGLVRFLGHRDDVPRLLAAADLLVLPSLYEGLPNVVLEAMRFASPWLRRPPRGRPRSSPTAARGCSSRSTIHRPWHKRSVLSSRTKSWPVAWALRAALGSSPSSAPTEWSPSSRNFTSGWRTPRSRDVEPKRGSSRGRPVSCIA